MLVTHRIKRGEKAVEAESEPNQSTKWSIMPERKPTISIMKANSLSCASVLGFSISFALSL